MLDTPVVLVVFNRAETTRRVLAQIRAARPRQLFIVADGPRANRPDDAERCAAVRALIDGEIDWACDVRRNVAESNLGCARRVSSGLDWVFSHVEEAIILEDDCLPDETFFPFCAELLGRYREKQRVAQIAGCSFQKSGLLEGPSYYFSRYPHCWGWATWRRAWQYYDYGMQSWRSSRGESWLAGQFEHVSERQFWVERLDATARNQIDSWAYRWTSAVWARGDLSVLPYQNLVVNIGFGGDATHPQTLSEAATPPVVPLAFPLVHPVSINRDVTADEYTSRLLFQPASRATRLRRRIRKIIFR